MTIVYANRFVCGECGAMVGNREHHAYVDCAIWRAEHDIASVPYSRAMAAEIRTLRAQLENSAPEENTQ